MRRDWRHLDPRWRTCFDRAAVSQETEAAAVAALSEWHCHGAARLIEALVAQPRAAGVARKHRAAVRRSRAMHADRAPLLSRELFQRVRIWRAP